ncbi:DUF1203 domain-containing protein [Streptomyces sp. NPDC101776]|uniref:DUF1203 domain-containing protein n=1 Tax=Streptomyces sp. NPDC101776 TaxID=3366146 RepID=UPI0037F33E82
MTTYTARPIDPTVLKELRSADDAGSGMVPARDEEGGAPLRCCLRRSERGERIALVSYAPLRRWATEPGAYDEVGPVFVHAEECGGPAAGSGYPFAEAHRVIRRYSAEGHILGGELVDTLDDEAFQRAFTDPSVVLVHVRAVEYGCFHFEVRRA